MCCAPVKIKLKTEPASQAPSRPRSNPYAYSVFFYKKNGQGRETRATSKSLSPWASLPRFCFFLKKLCLRSSQPGKSNHERRKIFAKKRIAKGKREQSIGVRAKKTRRPVNAWHLRKQKLNVRIARGRLTFAAGLFQTTTTNGLSILTLLLLTFKLNLLHEKCFTCIFS